VPLSYLWYKSVSLQTRAYRIADNAKMLKKTVLASSLSFLYTVIIMSPLGIQRTVSVLLLLSPWFFIPSVFKDVVFLLAGALLFISTLDLSLRKKVVHSDHHQETESKPSLPLSVVA
jgi:hypothetical protein